MVTTKAKVMFAVAMVALGSAASCGETIFCEGRYGGHLQGTDAVGTNIWWSFTKMLVRTDLSGRVLASREVPSHHGDLCVKGDTLYVAVNLGCFNTKTGGVSLVMSYDAETLAPRDSWTLDMPYGAGGMTWHGDRFYVVGGLPPTDPHNYVHEYDVSFRLVKRHVLDTGYTDMGIQTAAFVGGCFLFGIYGHDGNPGGTLLCPPDLSSFRRYAGEGAVGYATIGGRLYAAIARGVPIAKVGVPELQGADGALHPAERLLDDANLFSSPWYANGVPKGGPIRAAQLSSVICNVSEWCKEAEALVQSGHNAVVMDVVGGFALPSQADLACLRDIGLEPIPRLDFSAAKCAWTGKPFGTVECREACLAFVVKVRKVFGYPRYMQVVAEGWPQEDRKAFHDAVLANGYGSCPWPVIEEVAK